MSDTHLPAGLERRREDYPLITGGAATLTIYARRRDVPPLYRW